MGVVALCLIFLNKAWLALGLPLVGWDDATKVLGMDDILLLSSVLSSADEVAALAMVNKNQHPKLSALLFGEGVLNDAVSILLFRSVLKGDAESSLYAGKFLCSKMRWREVFFSCLAALSIWLNRAFYLKILHVCSFVL